MRLVALLAALVGALVIPGAPPGIGVVAVAVLIAAAAMPGARRSTDLVLFGAPALVLAAFPALLDARWVVVVDVLAAWLFATIAVGGPRLLAPLAPVVALPQLPRLLPESSSRAVPALRSAAIGTALVVPFAVLFLTADAAFAALADNVPRPQASSIPGRLVAFVFVLLAAVSLALGARMRLKERVVVPRRRLAFVEWALPLAVLDALFLAFVAVQLTVLFGGNDHVLKTAGLTYAEYARQGFWQLIAAAALTLVVVKGATLVAQPRTTTEERTLQLLLGLLCALTLVVLASALHRLMLYVDAFGLTRPRLAAEGFILWLGGTFAILLLLGALRRAASFPRTVLVWTASALVAFSIANPDARIADRNVERWRETGRLDVGYVSTLSADAVPALSELPAPLRPRVLARIADRLSRDEPWSSANLSRARAELHLTHSRSSLTRPKSTPSTHSP
jgi:Domain of unknown function (DUF4173)